MLHDFHFKIVHCLKSKHSNVDALGKNLIFVSNDNEDFQVEVLDQVVFVSKSAIENEVCFRTDSSKFHEMPNLFTLSKKSDDLLLKTTKGKGQLMQSQELALKKMSSILPPIC